VDQRRATWESEAHFLAAAARAIRHVLINYARDRRAQKRGGDWQRVSLDEHQLEGVGGPVGPWWEDRVLALDEALQRLASRSERQSRIVECRFFGGMTVQQTAHALGVSVPTVTRGWTMARAWLHRELDLGPAAPGS
jgi:RNA polymerase sigma factor (TIGR02999 family)